MGEISRSVLVNHLRVKALLDSGATENFISKRIADKLRLYITGSSSFITADGKKHLGKTSGVWIEMNWRGGSTDVVITDILPQDGYDIILGQNFLQDNEVILDFSKDKMSYGKHQPKKRRIGRLR